MNFLTIVLLLLTTGLAVGGEVETSKAAEVLRQAAPVPTTPLGYIFNLDAPPQFAWQNAAPSEAAGLPAIEEVVWFDEDMQRFEQPAHGGRWVAVIRSHLPDGRTVLRSRTLFARTEGFFLVSLESLGLKIEMTPDGATSTLAAHGTEVRRLVERPVLEMINGKEERSAWLAAALHDAGQADADERLRYGIEDRARQTMLRARLSYLGHDMKELPTPRRLEKVDAALALHAPETSLEIKVDAELNRICQSWADESGAGFVSLVARCGEILHHRAYTPEGQAAIGLDFRADVYSITKSISGLLAARFLDAGFFSLDDPVSSVLPGFSEYPDHVPTFRQCLRHESGLQGHGSWGGVGNVWFDHYVLNGIETLHPGVRKYAGDGFDLVGSSMQWITGETVTRLFHRSYFEPLGLPPMPFDQMGAGARPTAFELAVLGQILANGGRYGDYEFFSRETFASLLPTPYDDNESPDPDNKNHFYGLGIRWVREHKDNAGKPLFSPRTVGHGSYSHSVFQVDLDNNLVIAQVREKGTPADATWYPQFLQVVSRLVKEE